MGKGNVCVHNEYEGLFYIDNDNLDFYRKANDDSDEPELRSRRELSFEDIAENRWVYDQDESETNWEDVKTNFQYAVAKRFLSFTPCKERIGRSRDRLAILENNLFYIAVEDNQWSQAVLLIQKDDKCLTGLQKRHYQNYLDGIRDALFEQFESLGIYGGAWTSGTIHRNVA